MKSTCPTEFCETVLVAENSTPNCNETLMREASLPCLHREDVLNAETHWFQRVSALTFRNTPERIAEVLVSASVKARQTTCYAMLHGQLHQKILLRNLRLPLKIAKEILGEFAQERLRILSLSTFAHDLGSEVTSDQRAWYSEVTQATLDAPTQDVAGIISHANQDIYATRLFAYLVGAMNVRIDNDLRRRVSHPNIPANTIMLVLEYARKFRDDYLFWREVGA